MKDDDDKGTPVLPEHLAQPLPFDESNPPDGYRYIGGFSRTLVVDDIPPPLPTRKSPGCAECSCAKHPDCDGKGIMQVGKNGFTVCVYLSKVNIADAEEARNHKHANGKSDEREEKTPG